MSSPVPLESTVPETASCSGSRSGTGRFGDLRGVQWRIDLGILPSSPSASVDDLRRLTANSRRRYAALRRQLLVDPHVPKDGSNSPDPVMDNPLSQNPDSMWGRFFRNAELERMVDQDLTRLYPERGSYFQTSGCQGILRRILLLWCLRHPEYGYRQGMHELLAPLLYVLHVDVERLSEVRKVYDDHFADKFDGFSFHENDLTYKFDFKKFSEHVEFGNEFENSSSTLSELGPEIQNIVLLSDAYGAEGELGIVLSEKFMEHDAYSMFDALMSGVGGVISMAEFFSPSPSRSSHSGYAPVIEASAAIYHLLSIVDISLHSHLIELGVEPQYFTLRWLRVLFGREFSLEDLLVTWDEIFARENAKKSDSNDEESNFAVLESPRGAFITAFAVSMILNLRSSLLATENATICLQRLLNFRDDVKLVKLLEKVKSLQAMAVNANSSSFRPVHLELLDGTKPMVTRGHTLSLDSSSPKTPVIVPESYWEEKWRVLHKEEEENKVASEEQVPNRRKGWSERVKLRLSRTESDPTPGKKNERTKTAKPFVRRSLLDDLARQLGMDEDNEKSSFSDDVEPQDAVEINEQDVIDENLGNTQDSVEIQGQDDIDENLDNTQDSVEIHGQDVIDENLDNNTQSGEENSSNFSESPIHENSNDHENESRASSVASNSLIDENDAESCGTNQDDDISSKCTKNDDQVEKGVKERKLLSGKFQWLWKFGRNANANDGTSDKKSESVSEDAKPGSGQNSVSGACAADGAANNRIDSSSGMSKGESVDQNLMGSLKNLGQSMLENIQVIEYVFQQDRGQTENLSKNGIVGKGQVTAMAALKELRKMSNLLSEM